MWALGVVLYKMLFNEYPFGRQDKQKLLKQI